MKDYANARTYAEMADGIESTEQTREILRLIDETDKSGVSE